MRGEVYGWLLVLLFGLRHGMAADHIAVIDGLGMHLTNQGKSEIVPWLGSLFALGHGMIITIFIALASTGIHILHSRLFQSGWFDWVPVSLLLVIAILNLRSLSLHRAGHHHPFLLQRDRFSKAGSLSGLLIGLCILMVFDTLTDVASWGYTASVSGNLFTALLTGAVFTIGMLITDTLDSRLLAKVIERASFNKKISRQRRLLSLMIAVFSLGIGLQKLLAHYIPALSLSETANILIGLSLILVVGINYISIYKTISGTQV